MPNVIDAQGKVVRDVAVSPVFSADVSTKGNAIFRAVHREMASERSGTHKTKKRDEVRGGGKKPWKQKGTGRARQGSTRSPQWRHGGVVFGPQPRSYVTSLNKKERRAALGAALTDRFTAGVVTLLDTTGLAIEKTKAFATLVFGSPKGAIGAARTLVVFAPDERETIGQSLIRGGGNLAAVAVTGTDALDVRDVVGAQRVILTTAAYDVLVGAFANRETK